MKKISIITVCYNEEQTIEQTINSIVDQSYGNYEFLVLDGGSTDRTLEILRSHSKHIDIIQSAPDTGIYNAMNKGIELSSGDYIIFINSGDYLVEKNTLLHIAQYLNGDDIIYGDSLFSYSGKILPRKNPFFLNKYSLLRTMINHQAIVARRDLLQRCQGFDENYHIAADYDFLFKAMTIYKAKSCHIPIHIAVFNMEGISSDPSNYSKLTYEFYEIQKKYLNYFLSQVARIKLYLGAKRIFFIPRNCYHMVNRLLFCLGWMKYFKDRLFS